MCGIAGILSETEFSSSRLWKMAETLHHRGPDDRGIFISGNALSVPQVLHHPTQKENCQIGLAHTRLAIIDHSEAAQQPMQSANGRYTLVFNGELYNYREIKITLRQEGVEFLSDSDTEVVLKALEKWGVEAFSEFRGMWALAFWDEQEKELILSRDRFGIKPLFWIKSTSCFAFASEVKSLAFAPGFEIKPNENAALSYVLYGALSNPFGSFFRDVQDFIPGTWMRIKQNADPEIKTYFEIGELLKPKLDEESQQSFERSFRESITLHLRSDEEVGSCLSGGLDSSAIVHFAAQMTSKSLQTFSAIYPGDQVDEGNYAQMVVDGERSRVQPHFITPTSADLWRDWEKMIWHQEAPVGSSSIFAQWCVMKAAAKEGIKVLLDGQGSDEYLGGYYNFAGMAVWEDLRKFKFLAAHKTYYGLKKNFTPNMRKALLQALSYGLPTKLRLAVRKKSRNAFSFLSENGIQQAKEAKIPERGAFGFNELAINSLQYGLYELLRYEDRNSMAFSIESRVPFLDHQLVKSGLHIPVKERCKNGWTKFPLRKMLENQLPSEVVWRKDKKGFVTPQQKWLTELNSEIKRWLTETELPPFLNRDSLLNSCDKSLSSPALQSEFWRVLSVIKWWEIFGNFSNEKHAEEAFDRTSVANSH